MEATFQIFLVLLTVLSGTVLLARRLHVAPAILQMLAGVTLAFVPGMPSLELPPELVLLVVLPPRYFTDYLIAMKLKDGWQIVSKSYRYDLR